MTTTLRETAKTMKYQLIMLVFSTITLTACDSQIKPNSVTRVKPSDSSGCGTNCTDKPTPNSGDKAAAHTAISLIGVKQVSRAIDLIFNNLTNNTSTKCLKTELNKSDKKTLTISVYLGSNASSSCSTGWQGTETYKISYKTENNENIDNILSIEKESSQLRFKRSFNGRQKKVKMMTLNDSFKMVSASTGDGFTIEYNGKLTHNSIQFQNSPRLRRNTRSNQLRASSSDLNSQNSTQVDPLSSVQFLTDSQSLGEDAIEAKYDPIKITGKIRIINSLQNKIIKRKNVKVNQTAAAWSELKADILVERFGQNNNELHSQFSITQSSLESPTVCGIPVMHLTGTQTSQRVAGGKTYEANYSDISIVISEDPEISIRGHKVRFTYPRCNDSYESIFEIIDRADNDIGL